MIVGAPGAGADSVFVTGIEFEGSHGATAYERKGTRRFRVDVTIQAALDTAARTDKLSDTVDYAKVCELVVGIGAGTPFRLLEACAGAMLDAIGKLCPGAVVTLRLEKLGAACRGTPAACGVAMTRSY